LNSVIEWQRKLIATLDTNDVEGIVEASEQLARHLRILQGGGAWHATDVAREKIDYALRQTTAARMRVNYLTDWTRQKIEMLRRLRGGEPRSRYEKPKKEVF
jgi:hypothetical protein